MKVEATDGIEGLQSWESQLLRLARDADALAAAERDAGPKLKDRIELASRGFALLFLTLTPEVIAASCRATAQLQEPVLAGVAPLDQQIRDARRVRRSGLVKVAGVEVSQPELVMADEPAAAPPPAPVAASKPETPAMRSRFTGIAGPDWLSVSELAELGDTSRNNCWSWLQRHGEPHEIAQLHAKLCKISPALGERFLARSTRQRSKASLAAAPPDPEQSEQEPEPPGLSALLAELQGPG